MSLLDDIKYRLGESSNESDLEVLDLIEAAKLEMESKGLDKSKIVETDPLVKQAIVLYCKANYKYEDPKIADRFQYIYEQTLNHMLLSGMYSVVME